MVVVSSITVFMGNACVKSRHWFSFFDLTNSGASNWNTPAWVNTEFSGIVKSSMLRWNIRVERSKEDVTIKGIGSVIWVLTKPLCRKLSLYTKNSFTLEQTMAWHWVWLGFDPNNWVWIFTTSNTQLSSEGTSGVIIRESSALWRSWTTHPWIAACTYNIFSWNICKVHSIF